MKRTTETVRVDGRLLELSNLSKVLYPGIGYTKADVINYYVRVAPILLPHLKNRPVTLIRFPDGVRGEHFYEKEAPGYTPAWVKRFAVPSQRRNGIINYILINDLSTLVWLANLANLEIHPFLHRAPSLQQPTSIVFDLDPGQGADILTCGRVALLLRELLRQLNLESFVKVSGSKGLQLYVPLNAPTAYDVTSAFAMSIAKLMVQRHPDLVVSNMAKRLRTSRVLIDWSQNNEHKTTVSVYSLRAKTDIPYVSMPVTWHELKSALKACDGAKLYFQPAAALARIEKRGDLFETLLKVKQQLPSDFSQFGTNQNPPPSAKSRLKNPTLPAFPDPISQPASPYLPQRSRQGSRRRFVIQKHAASHLHYDLRLEMHGVLKSWAVPKGPPFADGERRLAMATEDHPLDYLSFEGIIPKGQYGGGTVMVWDIGTYELIEGNYYKGELRFYLSGQKLKGEWQLIKDRHDGKNKWHLVKADGSVRTILTPQDDKSALSRRTMRQIADAPEATWQSNRTTNNAPRSSAKHSYSDPRLIRCIRRI
jgi:bifunctional non-homologous end joining protein LigD